MNTREILGAFAQIQPMQALAAAAEHAAAPIHLQGLAGSGFALATASLYASTSRPIVAILHNKEEAQYFKSDLEHLLVGETIYFLPDSFLKPYNLSRENAMGVQERIETLNALRRNNKRIFVTYTSALAEFVVDKAELEKSSIETARGQSLDTEFLMEFLQANGFERRDFIFEPGEFSVRGGIVDLFSFAHEYPFRIDLDGDIIESIRTFDVNDQLSLKEIAHFSLLPNIQEQRNQETTFSITDYFDSKTIVVAQDMAIQIEDLAKAWEKALQVHQEAVDFGREVIPKHPKQIWNTPKGFVAVLDPFTQIHYSGNRPTGKVDIIEFYQQPQPLFKRNFPMLIDWMQQNEKDGYKTLVFSENSRQIERLTTILADTKAQATFDPVYQGLSAGFVDRDVKIAFATEHQLFDKYYRPKGRQKYSSQTSLTLRELKNLKPGDFVTHIDHGIGRFAGLEKMDVHGVTQEVVRIVYKDNDLLYVSVNSLHKISKYTGKDGTPPSMHKLGSPQWDKQKKATKKKVKDIARELIALYAKRKAQQGFAFGPDNYLQMELEASFFYEDTPDQGKAVEDTKRDMESPQPMDRLVCGDVGFGKTEVAMRAAFKAVCDSKQVAVLVPTTILAQQHYRSFTKRFAGFPITVDYINRFKSAKEQKATLDKVKEGKVDVLIGTHRILGKDIEFKDLGLMIIDEEQKFGVAAKEKLKERKVNVDSLTLTATPIPRTLHFSLMGARDLSIINTPPPNRQPVHTELHTFNTDLIAEAVTHELERGGQVFFVHSRVKDIHELARMIADAVPGCRVCVAHGQMEGHELEDVMVQFIEGEYDVLVATTIIESGLDIPNANTIIINNAHQFGLSDLHQLRGRVGRSNRKAYCYLFAPPISVLPPDSRKRLKTIEEFSEIGSGFDVAMRDLDIRGAGNLLGGEQSGFIADIGYDTYQKILTEAIMELKEGEFKDVFAEENKKKGVHVNDAEIETDVEMLIPAEYVENTQERLNLYTQLDDLQNEEQLTQFGNALTDRFGKLPEQVIELFDGLRLRWAAKELGFERVILKEGKLRCYFVLNPQAAFYESDKFRNIMNFINGAGKQNQLSLKHSPKSLIMVRENVRTLKGARKLLELIREKTQ